jgi:hypothetical protein
MTKVSELLTRVPGPAEPSVTGQVKQFSYEL